MNDHTICGGFLGAIGELIFLVLQSQVREHAMNNNYSTSDSVIGSECYVICY